jgi:hypothetical protein
MDAAEALGRSSFEARKLFVVPEYSEPFCGIQARAKAVVQPNGITICTFYSSTAVPAFHSPN